MKFCILSFRCIRSFAIVGLLSIAFPAYSAFLVDTGPGPDPFPGTPWVFNGSEKFAGQFQLAENSTVNSIEAWMGINGFGTGFSFNVLIYSDIGGLPGNALFSDTAFAPAPANIPAGETYGFGWYGNNLLNWDLTAGTYWVAFEGSNSEELHALTPGISLDPLASYARNNAFSNLNGVMLTGWISA